MATLKEIKGRIGSVKSTLKITSAMKMVASAKLHKAQSAIEGMLPYQQSLKRTLDELLKQARLEADIMEARPVKRVTLVCIASNSSLCGGFNANAIREARARLAALKEQEVEEITVLSVGRKMAEAMRKAGYPSPEDFTGLSAKPSYEVAADLSDRLVEDFREGRTDRVELIYNHFVSTAVHKTVCEAYLPMDAPVPEEGEEVEDEYIIEPDKEELLSVLVPKILKLKIYTVLLDAAAAEHAARTVAMQTATDNAEDLLQELSLEYNKSRQAKITAEILDLAGGMQEQA
jgi:F-type H+-transporting ATPase subunit gamma